MPDYPFRIRTVAIIGCSLFALLPVTAADAETKWRTHTIVDREGFDEAVPAIKLRVPRDWKVKARIAWRKPCSALPLFETIYRITSPSGRAGMRLAPSYNIIWTDFDFGKMFPAHTTADLRARFEADRERMRESFRGSNCRLGWVRDGDQLIRNIILPSRSPNARILSVKDHAARRKALEKQAEEVTLPKTKTTVGALLVRLTYPTKVGEIEEEISLAWSTSLTEDVHPQYGGSITQNTIVYPIASAWAPVGRLDAYRPAFVAIGKSVQNEKAWDRRVASALEKLRQKRAKEFRQRQDERKQEFDKNTQRWKQRQREREADNQRFIRSVIQGQFVGIAGMTGEAAGQVPPDTVRPPQEAATRK